MRQERPDTEGALVALIGSVRETGYRFTTVTPASHARVNARPDALWARDLRDIFGWSRPFREAIVSPEMLAAMRRAGVVEPVEGGWRATIRLSSLDGELFLHTAYPPNATDAVFFGPDTVRFVSAVTAFLAERAAPVRRAVDLGAGSGAAGIAVAKRARDAEVLLVDINPAALRAGRINARAAGVTNIVPRQSNLLREVEGAFDLIVSNPPFMIDRGGRTYRHGGGAYGEGLSLAVVEAAAERLAPGGSLVLFTGSVIVRGGDPFREAALAVCARAGLRVAYREFDPDAYGEELDSPAYAEADRIALVVLTATRPA
ncbi:methyltransferase [Methylobacterium sp. Leaf118]|uniref:methyltransferase n=1 Tax=Methylobacterium sp. Leaf118 TaxID=2876562 RepID=UPI001E339436|nr:methyltransferase [Methylobacterium sp. Leaf118]